MHIGGNEVFLLTDAHHQRAATTCGNQFSGLIPVDHAQGIGTFQVFHGSPDCGKQVFALIQIEHDLVGDDFGVGIRGKAEALPGLFGFEFLEILDNAVVHNGNAAIAYMRMRIVFRRHAMCGPAGMRNTQLSGECGLS